MKILLFLAAVIFPSSANAYIGPGAAIGLLGSVLGFSSLVVVGIIFTFAWPAWLIYKYYKKKKTDTGKNQVSKNNEDKDK